MPEIITDHAILHKKSENVTDLEIDNVVQQLSISIPIKALGLAAPQIGIHKRVFMANLSSGSYVFINPEITWNSSGKIPSSESCLSLPDINRCVERYSQITISCYKLLKVASGELNANPEPIRLKGLDSFVCQHEIDHLDGVLIIDLPETLTREGRLHKKTQEKYERMQQKRLAKKTKITPAPKLHKLSVKNAAKKKRTAEKEKRRQQTFKRQNKISVEIQEKYSAEKEGLFSNNTPSSSESINEPKSD